MLDQRRFYFARFDPEPANFYLLINAAQKFDLSIGAVSAQIAGTIDARAILSGEPIGNKAIGAQSLPRYVMPSHPYSANQQFTRHADRHRLIVRIDDVSSLIRDGAPDSDVVRGFDTSGHRPHRCLGGSIQIPKFSAP